MTTGTCANVQVCGAKDGVLHNGYCKPCYDRLRRRGTAQPANMKNYGPCEHPGCTRKSFAKHLCSKHYQQAQHPLKNPWKRIRSTHPGAFPPAWVSFAAFIADVGDMPGPNYQLRRIRRSLPWSAANCEWREPIRINGKTGLGSNAAAYQRAWNYLRKFGLREGDIDRMKSEQDGACPICTRPLERLDPDTGKPVRICVDHDHITGAVRGLLCDPCNKGLGHFDDRVDDLRRGIAYLGSHASK